jgi:uncharacterized protein (TIRG00374 family)
MMMKQVLQLLGLISPIVYNVVKLKLNYHYYLLSSIILLIFICLSLIVRKRKYVNFCIQLGISYIFLDITFHHVDFDLLVKSFSSLKIGYLLLAILTIYLNLLLRAYKWKYLFPQKKEIRFSSLWKTVSVGFMVNAVFPARAGEFYRAYFLNRLENIKSSTIFATVVFERIVDGLVVSLGIVYILLFSMIENDLFVKIGMISLVVYILAIMLLILFYFHKKKVLFLIFKILFFLPSGLIVKLDRLLNTFSDGLHVLKDSNRLFPFVLYSIIDWGIVIFTNLFLLYSMNVFQNFNILLNPINISLLLLVCNVIGVSIPSGPGALGPFHASIFFMFFLLDPLFVELGTMHYNHVATFSMYMWLVFEVTFILPGFYYFSRENLKFDLS